MADSITVGTLNSPAECIDLDDQLASERDESGQPRQLAFRGQSRKFGTLVPSFRRLFVEQKSPLTAQLIESELIKAFRDHYKSLIKTAMADMPSSDAIGSGRELRCLSVMQHYGVPTRLLDWTANFWTAMYFACASDPGEDAELWCYDRKAFVSASFSKQQAYAVSPGPDIDAPILQRRDLDLVIEETNQLTPRMIQQKAHHTVAAKVFADHAPLIHAMVNTEPEPHFKRVIIAQRAKDRVLKYLNDHREISASRIFPDFEGLGRFLRWQLDSLLTTLM